MKVLFYPGCTAHSTGLEYNDSLHAVFESLGVEFQALDDWNCCGGAAAHSLSKMLALGLSARNIKQAQPQSDLPLAISCAGCFNATRVADYHLTHDRKVRRELEATLDFTYTGEVKILPFHEVLTRMIGLDALKAKIQKPLAGLKVASYYGCALVRNPKVMQMGDHDNPIFLDEIAASLGAEAVDWSYKTDCCGADIALSHGKIAIDLADKIVEGAREAGANCMMAACGLCQINLDMRQSGKNGPKLPQFYYTELMGIALHVGKRKKWWEKHIVSPLPLLNSVNLH